MQHRKVVGSLAASAHETPEFFSMSVGAVWGSSVPHAKDFQIDVEERICPRCSDAFKKFGRSPSCTIVNAGVWPDVMAILPWAMCLFSSRVIDGLAESGATGFRAHAVSILGTEPPNTTKAPRYFMLDVTGRIEIDKDASGLGEVEQCPVCFRSFSTRLIEATRYVPIPSTWDGSTLCLMRNRPTLEVFCTRQVVELARAKRFSNMRFAPMDVVRAHATDWPGINYLGEEWPPREWYPSTLHAGRSIDEWISQLCSDPHPQYVPAHRALIDLSEEAVPHLIPLLSNESPITRKRGARILSVIHGRGKKLTSAVKARVVELLADDPDFLHGLTDPD